MDSKLFSLHTIETFWNKIKNKCYIKPVNGIPKSDLDATVQSSLSKADSALQEHQDISGKQDKSTAVTHSANTAVGSAANPVYVAANGVAIPISHSINSDVPANAKFTDTTYSDATESTHGLMTAADKKKLDGMDLSKYLPKDGTAEKAKAMSDGTLRSGFYVNSAANATTGHVWFRMATCKISGAYESVNTTFLITNGMAYHALLTCGIRNDGTGKAVESCTLWLSARNSIDIPPGMFRVVAINSSTGVTYELWGQISARWQGVRYTVLDERNISGGKYNIWTLESHSDADAKIAPTIGNYYVNSSDISVCATATKAETLTDSGWIIPTFPSGIKNSTIRYRKQGKIVSVSGYVTFSESVSAKVVLTLPEGYRPPAKIQQFNAIDGSAQPSFLTTIDTNGKVSFVGKTQGFFTTANEYYIHCTFFVD